MTYLYIFIFNNIEQISNDYRDAFIWDIRERERERVVCGMEIAIGAERRDWFADISQFLVAWNWRRKKKDRLPWTTRGHSSVKSTSRGCHGNGTGVERAGRAESRRRGETSGCFEKVHTLLALCTRHLPPPPPFSSLLVRRHFSPYRQWRLRPGSCTVSLTRGVLLDYDREIPKSSTRRISVSLSPLRSTRSWRESISGLVRSGFYVSARPTFSSFVAILFRAYVVNANLFQFFLFFSWTNFLTFIFKRCNI